MKKSQIAVLIAFALVAPAFAQDAAAPATDAAPAVIAAPATDAAPAVAATPVTEEAPAVAAALSPAIVAKVGTPEPGKGLVVFFRPSKFVGGGAGIKIHEGEMEHGKLGNGTWIALQMEPGVHEFVAKGEVKDVNPIEVEAGETYFIEASIGMGLVAGRKNFVLTDAAAFEAVMGKLKAAKPLKK